MKKIVVIPTYNEIENIHGIIAAVTKVVPDIHVLIVDDNSPDGTPEAVLEIQKSNPDVHLMKRKGKMA